jgi:hypothetical protein
MPLFDHFKPGTKYDDWEGVHNTWPAYITEDLNNRRLPAPYRATPRTHQGWAVEADVATFEEEEEALETAAEDGNGGVATAVWAPPAPPLVARIDFADLDVFEVRVYDERRARTLVAAIELVSPANKDRPSHRRDFVAKCSAYLQQQVSVVVVDVVTERHDNLHAEFMQFLDLEESFAAAVSSNLYAVAYRTRGKGKRQRMEMWPAALALGQALPVMPLWLATDLVVPIDLEPTYIATCKALRMPVTQKRRRS